MPPIAAALSNRISPWWAGLALAIVITVMIVPEHSVRALEFAAWNLVLVSPVVMVGVLLTAGITATGSMAIIASAFEGRDFRMIGLASLVGAFTPVCGITVLPLIASLLIARVPLAPIMAFWLSSPITSPGMLAVTAGTLGMPFAVGKSLGALFIGLFAGVVVHYIVRAGFLTNPSRDLAHVQEVSGQGCSSSCSGGNTVRWTFWREPARLRTFTRTAVSTGRLILLWLSIAFVAEYVLKLLLPENVLAGFVGADSFWAVPIAATVGAPIYLDGYAALPLVRGLIDAGMAQDAAMAFLIAGGIISAWAVIPVLALVRLPVFLVYVGLAIVTSMLTGFAFGLWV